MELYGIVEKRAELNRYIGKKVMDSGRNRVGEVTGCDPVLDCLLVSFEHMTNKALVPMSRVTVIEEG